MKQGALIFDEQADRYPDALRAGRYASCAGG